MLAMSLSAAEEDDKDEDDAAQKGGALEMGALTAESGPPTLVQPAPPLTLSLCCQARRCLYASHAAAQCSESAWQFAVALVLAAFTDYRSLALVSTYGLMGSFAVAGGVAPLGAILDRAASSSSGGGGGGGRGSGSRLRLARWLIGLENAAVVVATLACVRLLAHPSSLQPPTADGEAADDGNCDGSLGGWRCTFRHVPLDGWQPVAWLFLIHALGSLANVLDQAFLVAMERDWIVVLSHAAARADASDADGCGGPGDGEGSRLSAWLSDTNVRMKQIDLACKVVAPAVIGLLVPGGPAEEEVGGGPVRRDLQILCAAVGALNAVALAVEYVCTAQVYRWIPDLQRGGPPPPAQGEGQWLRRGSSSSQKHESLAGEEEDHVEGHLVTEGPPSPSTSLPPTKPPTQRCGSEWMVYWRQPCAGAGLALALLYVNALTFGNGVLTAYLLSRGLDTSWIGLWRGVAAVIGLLGTCAFHWSVRHSRSLEDTALTSVLFQFTCLAAALASVLWLAPVATMGSAAATLSLALLIGGVCLSRIGLWVFDIAVTQMQQEEVPDGVRGQVGAVQQSLNALLRVLSFAPGLLYPDPDDFAVCVSTAVAGVGLAFLSFLGGVHLPRRLRHAAGLGQHHPVRQVEEDEPRA